MSVAEASEKNTGRREVAGTLGDPRAERIRALKNRLVQLTSYLKKDNNSIRSMGYFYDLADNLLDKRAREIEDFKKGGGKVVGVFCNFVPEEIVIAAGAIPVGLSFGFSETILRAEEYLPRNFCPLIKSSFGSFLDGNPLFDLCDVVIIPTSCDGKKKLGEIVAPHKPVWIMEVPHSTNTSQSRNLWLTEIKLLAKKLGKFTGKRVTRRKLSKAITLVNRKRAIVHRLYRARMGDPPIWGRDAMLVTYLSYFDDIDRWMEKTTILCEEIEGKKTFADEDMPRLLITGSPLVAPTWKVPVIIEESGGVVITDDLCTGTKGYWDPVERNYFTSDQLISIADRYLMNTCSCFTPNTARVVRLKQFVKEWSIDGAIYHVSQACHTYGMEQINVNREFDAIDIPVLNIETDFSQEDVEQIRTRVEAFLELLVARKRRRRLGEGALMPASDARGHVGGAHTPSSGHHIHKAGQQKVFSYRPGFPVYEQASGKPYVPKSGKLLDIEKLKKPER